MLQIKNLGVFQADKQIISQVSLELQPGHIHYLMGPNGSGKSSLALAIFGYPVYQVEGEIYFEDQSILGISPDKRAKLGLFLSMQYPPSVKGVTVLSLLKNAYQARYGKVNILDFRHQVLTEAQKLGFEESVLSRSINDGFSGGERKKLELLQLIILQPKLAVLDEPDSGVDIDAIGLISREIQVLANQGMTFLVITHYGQLQLSPDRVSILKNGQIVQTGDQKLLAQVQTNGFEKL